MRITSIWLLGVLAVAAAVGGCGGPVSAKSADILTAGLAGYLGGDDAEAVEQTGRFIALHPDAQEAGEAHYVRGLARCRLGDTVGGEADFSRALTLTRRNDLSGRAHLAIGLLADGRGADKEAEAGYLAALAALRRRDPLAEEALFRLGCLLQRGGQWLEADRRFDRLVFLFPASERAKDARRRVRGRAWTVQAGAFARWDNAIAQRDRLTRAGLSARIRPVRGRPALLAVQVGRYQTHRLVAEALLRARPHVDDALITIATE